MNNLSSKPWRHPCCINTHNIKINLTAGLNMIQTVYCVMTIISYFISKDNSTHKNVFTYLLLDISKYNKNVYEPALGLDVHNEITLAVWATECSKLSKIAISVSNIWKHIHRSDVKVNIHPYGHFSFLCHLFQLKLNLPSTVLLSGFLRSLGALKSTE